MLDEDVQRRIVEGLSLGMTYKMAADFAGISEKTLYNWLRKGREGYSPIYVQFLEAVKRTTAQNAAGHLSTIVKAAKEGRWQASAWMLERRFGWWAARDQSALESAEVEGTESDEPMTFEEVVEDLRRLPPELLRRALESSGEE